MELQVKEDLQEFILNIKGTHNLVHNFLDTIQDKEIDILEENTNNLFNTYLHQCVQLSNNIHIQLFDMVKFDRSLFDEKQLFEVKNITLEMCTDINAINMIMVSEIDKEISKLYLKDSVTPNEKNSLNELLYLTQEVMIKNQNILTNIKRI